MANGLSTLKLDALPISVWARLEGARSIEVDGPLLLRRVGGRTVVLQLAGPSRSFCKPMYPYRPLGQLWSNETTAS